MDNNLDVNLIIQVFQEKLNALMLESILKDATIRQLTMQLNSVIPQNLTEEANTKKNNKQKDDF